MRYYIRDLYRPVLLEINKIVHDFDEDIGMKPSEGVFCHHTLLLNRPLLIKGEKILGFGYQYRKSSYKNYFESFKCCEEMDNKWKNTYYREYKGGVRSIGDYWKRLSHNKAKIIG